MYEKILLVFKILHNILRSESSSAIYIWKESERKRVYLHCQRVQAENHPRTVYKMTRTGEILLKLSELTSDSAVHIINGITII